MRRSLLRFGYLVLLSAWMLLCFLSHAHAQTDNTFYAKQFAGATVGDKVKAAQQACNLNTSIPCYIVIEPSLAAWPNGNMPTLCAQCVWNDMRSNNTTYPNLSAQIVNFEQVALSTSIDPNTIIQAACRTSHPNVTLPAGTYVTEGIALGNNCSQLHVRCATTNLTGANGQPNGTVIQLAADATNPTVYNVNENASSGTPSSNQVNNVWWEGCVFDQTANRSQPALRLKGTNEWTFIGGGAVGNNNSVPLVVGDGSNFANLNGNYYVRFQNFKLYDMNAASTAVGVYISGAQEAIGSAGSNDWTFDGGGARRFGVGVKIDCGNNVKFTNFSLEDSQIDGAYLTTNTNGFGTCAAVGNTFISNRLEQQSQPTMTGYLFDSGAVRNTIYSPYFSGSFVWFQDNNPSLANSCFGYCLVKNGANSFTGMWYGNPSASGAYDIGVGMTPGVNGAFPSIGSPTGNIDVNGNVRLNNSLFQFIGQRFGLDANSVTYLGLPVWTNGGHALADILSTGHLQFGLNSTNGFGYQTAGNPTALRTITYPDANSNPVQPVSGATAGLCLSNISSDGIQHTQSCPQISATPTTNHASCWKSATQIGYCSTQPDATGSCTCN